MHHVVASLWLISERGGTCWNNMLIIILRSLWHAIMADVMSDALVVERVKFEAKKGGFRLWSGCCASSAAYVDI